MAKTPTTYSELSDALERAQARRERPPLSTDVGPVVTRFRALRRRRQWFDHLLIAAGRYDRRNGDMYAAGLTYYSFVVIFPLLLIAVAVIGFFLRSRADLVAQLSEQITAQIPGEAGGLLLRAIDAAQSQAATIGTLSLGVFLFLGTNWVGNLRTAIQRMWGTDTEGQNFLKEKAIDLVVLLGLGLAAMFSVGLTIVSGDITAWLVDWMGLGDVRGAATGIKVVATGAALTANGFLLYYVLVVLPRHRVPRRSVVRGVLLGAAGLELLKLLGTLFIGRLLASSPAAGFFGAVVLLLIWINLLCRWLMFVVCWTATSRSVLRAQLDALRLRPAGRRSTIRRRDPDRRRRENRKDRQDRPSSGAESAGDSG